MLNNIVDNYEHPVFNNFEHVIIFGCVTSTTYIQIFYDLPIFPIYKEKDIIGLAETGSGKTGAFALPILQALLENPQRLFALVMTPTR